jgi:hypothetical protein
MTFSRLLLTCIAMSAAPSVAFAAAPAAKPAPPSAAPVAKAGSTNARSATPPAPAPAAPKGVTLDDYMKELTADLKLSDSEKQEIQSYYVQDGVQVQKILADDSLSPLQQYQQVSELRDSRNARIKTLLNDLDRQHEFLVIEAKYRVTLTDLAANGQLVAAAPPPAPAK